MAQQHRERRYRMCFWRPSHRSALSGEGACLIIARKSTVRIPPPAPLIFVEVRLMGDKTPLADEGRSHQAEFSLHLGWNPFRPALGVAVESPAPGSGVCAKRSSVARRGGWWGPRPR